MRKSFKMFKLEHLNPSIQCPGYFKDIKYNSIQLFKLKYNYTHHCRSSSASVMACHLNSGSEKWKDIFYIYIKDKKVADHISIQTNWMVQGGFSKKEVINSKSYNWILTEYSQKSNKKIRQMHLVERKQCKHNHHLYRHICFVLNTYVQMLRTKTVFFSTNPSPCIDCQWGFN